MYLSIFNSLLFFLYSFFCVYSLTQLARSALYLRLGLWVNTPHFMTILPAFSCRVYLLLFWILFHTQFFFKKNFKSLTKKCFILSFLCHVLVYVKKRLIFYVKIYNKLRIYTSALQHDILSKFVNFPSRCNM